jgi:hypothetical protein
MKWRYIAGGLQRSDDGRFEISEHSEGFSVYDFNAGSAFDETFSTGKAAKRKAERVKYGGKVSYELDRRSAR